MSIISWVLIGLGIVALAALGFIAYVAGSIKSCEADLRRRAGAPKGEGTQR